MITKDRQYGALTKALVILFLFFLCGLILPIRSYQADAMDDRLFCAIGCIFVFCASICGGSEFGSVMLPVLSLTFGMTVGKNICGSSSRFIFSCIIYPLFFAVSTYGLLSGKLTRSTTKRFITAAGLISFAAALFLLCIYH